MNLHHVKPVFARHETFQPRFGWLQKAYEAGASSEGRVFTDDAATVALGVGKNMVRAIRFWGLASKVLRPFKDPSQPRLELTGTTRFGDALLGEDGWDPYLEDPGSLWLLHWALLRPPCMLPVWWVAFNEFDALEFQDTDLQEAVIRQVELSNGWPDTNNASVKKDVSCMLRMYSAPEQARSNEETVDCPFRQLRLLTGVSGKPRTYRFMLGTKPSLPPELIVFAALDFVDQATTARTATLATLASEPGGPGRVFRISEDDLALAIELLSFKGVGLASPAGARQLMLDDAPGHLATMVLNRYFGRRPGHVQGRRRTVFGDFQTVSVDESHAKAS